MTPIGDKILVKELAAEQMTKGGLHIPEAAKKRPGKAKVLFVSADIQPDAHKNLPKPGNQILMDPDAGHPVIYEGEDCLMITIDQVQAILKK